jgi:hypothetical protein
MEIAVVERGDGFPDNKPVGGIISNHKGRRMLQSIVSDLKRNPPVALLILCVSPSRSENGLSHYINSAERHNFT